MSDTLVRNVSAAAYTVPTDAPEADGTIAWTSTTLVVVSVTAGDVEGIGWSYTGSGAVDVVRDPLAGAVTGTDALDVPAAAAAMARAVRNLGRPGLAATAISAVDLALWDLKARLLGLPLCRLLGRARSRVPVYGSGGFTTYDDDRTRAQLEHWTGAGIPRVKIKIGEAWGGAVDRDLHRVALARQVIGPDAELFVDANGGYTRGQARRVAGRLAEHGVTWFEEPVSSDDLAGLAELRAWCTADIAAGEYGYRLTDVRRMLQAEAVDCLQVDVTRIGGVTQWLHASAVAEAHGLEVSAHCAPAAVAHVAAATPNLRHVEYFHDHVRIEEMLFDGVLRPVDGALVPEDGRPGLGVELRTADAEAYRCR
jgi:L-alanine-DL-glutamate epimerase-like enolase superfamily enzyme